ncbi:hypothetical protein KSP40_PGU004717 [Platanthera guangdongensis]|uniref:Uncharacterized protein n=1 Tax=Platanthera guangdongensis TaxID=2320717 RepID=A0ABR2M8U6_9ASPA
MADAAPLPLSPSPSPKQGSPSPSPSPPICSAPACTTRAPGLPISSPLPPKQGKPTVFGAVSSQKKEISGEEMQHNILEDGEIDATIEDEEEHLESNPADSAAEESFSAIPWPLFIFDIPPLRTYHFAYQAGEESSSDEDETMVTGSNDNSTEEQITPSSCPVSLEVSEDRNCFPSEDSDSLKRALQKSNLLAEEQAKRLLD